MKNSPFDNLKLKQLSSSIGKKVPIPIDKLGQRIKDIREAIGMTQGQFAKRLKVSQPVISRIEENIESSSLKTVLKIVRALECDFMGVIVSEVPLEKIVKRQAEKVAQKMVDRTFANMAMEKQGPGQKEYRYQLRKVIWKLMEKPSSILWKEE